jgi:hypothetical protein
LHDFTGGNSANDLEQGLRVFDLGLNEWPQLFEQTGECLRVLLGVLELLVEQPLAISQQSYQLLVL